MPLPNQGFNAAQPGYAWQPNNGNFMQYQQPQQQNAQWQQNFQQPQPSRVMSIAPANSRENAQQFPVAVNTDLYLVNRQEMRLYFKNNPANPSEMEEYELVKVEKQPEPNDTVTRAEIDELKAMMAQMMATFSAVPAQGPAQASTPINQNQQTARTKPNFNGKRGNRNDRSESVPDDAR